MTSEWKGMDLAWGRASLWFATMTNCSPAAFSSSTEPDTANDAVPSASGCPGARNKSSQSQQRSRTTVLPSKYTEWGTKEVLRRGRSTRTS